MQEAHKSISNANSATWWPNLKPIPKTGPPQWIFDKKWQKQGKQILEVWMFWFNNCICVRYFLQSLYLLSSLQRWAAELYHLHKLNPFVCCQVSKLPQQNIKISTEIQLNQIKSIWRHWTSVCLLSGGEIASAKHQNLNWNSTESNQIHLNTFDFNVFIIRPRIFLSKTSKSQLKSELNHIKSIWINLTSMYV